MKLKEKKIAELFWTWNNLCVRNNKGYLKDMEVEVDGKKYFFKLMGSNIRLMYDSKTDEYDYVWLREICRPYRKQVERKLKIKELMK